MMRAGEQPATVTRALSSGLLPRAPATASTAPLGLAPAMTMAPVANPATAASPTIGRRRLRRACALLPELCITVALVAYGLAMLGAVNVPTGRPFFLERDPTLSRQAKLTATVPTAQLALYGIIIPAIILAVLALWMAIVGQAVVAPHMRKPGHPRARGGCAMFWGLLLGLAESIGMVLAAVGTLKVATAQPRPGFFYLCDYAGYRSALDSGSFGPYFSSTTAGVPGSVSKCLDQSRVQDSVQGWPSGHAAVAFAGLGYAVLAVRWAWRVPHGRWFGLRSFIACVLLVLAGWIAVTRVRDGYHTTTDISTGTALGILAAGMAWANFRLRAARRWPQMSQSIATTSAVDSSLLAFGLGKPLGPVTSAAPVAMQGIATPGLEEPGIAAVPVV